MAGYSKLGRAIMREKGLGPVSGSRIKVYKRVMGMSGDHVDEAMCEMIDGRDKQIAALRARVVELETAMATALHHLEKGRAIWNGPSHQCAAALREALGMGEQSADAVQAWREQAKFWEEQSGTLHAENAGLVAALTVARRWATTYERNYDLAQEKQWLDQIDAALAAAGKGSGK